MADEYSFSPNQYWFGFEEYYFAADEYWFAVKEYWFTTAEYSFGGKEYSFARSPPSDTGVGIDANTAVIFLPSNTTKINLRPGAAAEVTRWSSAKSTLSAKT